MSEYLIKIQNPKQKQYFGFVSRLLFVPNERNKLAIITYDVEDKQHIQGKTIKLIPLWKWLLEIKEK